MINYVRGQRKNNQRPKISLECEKVRDFETLEDAIEFVDVVFVSKDFARSIIQFRWVGNRNTSCSVSHDYRQFSSRRSEVQSTGS